MPKLWGPVLGVSAGAGAKPTDKQCHYAALAAPQEINRLAILQPSNLIRYHQEALFPLATTASHPADARSITMDTTMTSPDVTSQPPVVFRGKKRKAFRQRPTDEEAESTTKPADTAATNSTTLAQNADTPRDSDTPVPPQPSIVADAGAADKNEEEEEQVRLSVAHILRQRNARKSRLRGGVGFGADDSAARAADDDLAQMIREEEQKALEVSTGGMSKRFTAQTGFSTDLANKHM